MKLVKVPSSMRLLCGAALAYWLAGTINPAFVAIAVMIVLFIPVFLWDYCFEKNDMPKTVKQPDRLTHQPIEPTAYHQPTNILQALGKDSTSELLIDDQTKIEADKAVSHKAKTNDLIKH